MSDSNSPPSLIGPMSLRPASEAEMRQVIASAQVGDEPMCPRCGEPIRVAPLSVAGPGFRRYECTHDACEFSFERPE